MPITLLDAAAGVATEAPSAPVTIGSNTEPGDLRIVRITASASTTFSVPSGWTPLYRSSSDAVSRHVMILTRVIQAGDDDTSSVPDDGSANLAWTAITVRGRNPSATLAPVTAGTDNSSRNVVAPSVATGAGVLLTWHDVTRLDQTANQGSWGVPSGMTGRASSLSDGPMGYNVLLASEPRSSGNSGSRTAVAGSAGSWSATSLFIAEGVSSVTKSGSDTARGSESGTVTARPAGRDTASGAHSGSATARPAGSDAGTGTESGYVSVPRAGGDSGTGSESGYVASGYTGGDSGSGTESGSLGARAAGSDTATGDESGEVGASLAGPGDSGAGTETGLIQIPGSDTAAGDESGDVDATAAGGDQAAGSEGGYVETLFGDLDVSLYAVDHATGELWPLPDFDDFEMVPTRNGPGTVSLRYPKDPDVGVNADQIAATIAAKRDLEVEIWTIGGPTGAYRAYLQEVGSDDVADETEADHLYVLGGAFLELRMGETQVYPQPKIGVDDLGDEVAVPLRSITDAQWDQLLELGYTGRAGDDTEQLYVPQKVLDAVKAGEPVPVLADPKRELVISAASPGEVMNLLLAQARARGALTDVVTSFTGSHDTAGNAWSGLISAKVSPGSTYESVLNLMVAMGRCEWSMSWTGQAPCLNLWTPEGRGVDRTLGGRPVILREGRNLAQAPRKYSVRSSPTAMLGIGAEGIYAETRDLNAEAGRGRRIEASTSSQNLTTEDAVLAYAQRRLATTKDPELSIEHALALIPGEPRPVVAFDVGDWVYSTVATENERYRVVEWSLRVDADRQLTAAVTLHDKFVDELVRQRLLLDAIASGQAVVGTSQPGEDTGVPAAPEGLVVGSGAFLEGPDVYAAVQAGWNAVQINVDGTAATDLDGYRVEWALASAPEAWHLGADVDAQRTSASFTVAPATPIRVRVQARDRNGNRGPWSTVVDHLTEDDATPPPIASAPVAQSWLGTLRITWDGLSAAGAEMAAVAPDFSHVELHLSQASLFTPDESTLVTQLFGRGTWTIADLPIGVTQFARLVAVDIRGNRSEPSEQGSAAPRQLLGPEIFEGAVGSAALADLAVVRAKIADLAVNDAKIANLSVGKVTAGTLTADVTLSGIIRTATTGSRTEIDNAGIRLYDPSGALRVNLRTTDGSALVTGEYRTALSGTRMVLNPGGAAPTEMRFYPASSNQYASLGPVTSVATNFEGQAGIRMKGHSQRWDNMSGEVAVFPDYASLAFGEERTGGSGIRGRVGLTEWDLFLGSTMIRLSTTYRAGPDGPGRGFQSGRVRFLVTDEDTGEIHGNSQLDYSAKGGDSWPRLVGFNADSGIQFDLRQVSMINYAGGLQLCAASQFVTGSSREIKTAFEPLPFDALEALRAARPYQYELIEERADPGRDGHVPKHIGLIAEDMPEVIQQRIVDGPLGLDGAAVTATLWAVARELDSRLSQLEAVR